MCDISRPRYRPTSNPSCFSCSDWHSSNSPYMIAAQRTERCCKTFATATSGSTKEGVSTNTIVLPPHDTLALICPHAPVQSTSSDRPLSALQLTLHPTLTILLPYAHTRLSAHMTSLSYSDMPSRDLRRRLWELLNRVQRWWAAAVLINFGVFLGDGK